MVYLVGVIYKGKTDIIGFRLKNMPNGKLIDVSYSDACKALRKSPKSVVGLEYSNGDIKPSNGAFSEYPIYRNGMLANNKVVIIFGQFMGEDKYKVYMPANDRFAEINQDEVIKLVDKSLRLPCNVEKHSGMLCIWNI